MDFLGRCRDGKTWLLYADGGLSSIAERQSYGLRGLQMSTESKYLRKLWKTKVCLLQVASLNGLRSLYPLEPATFTIGLAGCAGVALWAVMMVIGNTAITPVAVAELRAVDPIIFTIRPVLTLCLGDRKPWQYSCSLQAP